MSDRVIVVDLTGRGSPVWRHVPYTEPLLDLTAEVDPTAVVVACDATMLRWERDGRIQHGYCSRPCACGRVFRTADFPANVALHILDRG